MTLVRSNAIKSVMVLAFILVGFGARCSQPLSDKFELVRVGHPQAIILIGENCAPIERHAAGELRKYVKLMTGAELAVVSEPGKVDLPDNAVLIGRAETNPTIRDLCSGGRLKLSHDSPGLDGFIIKTVKTAQRNYLVIGGSQDRGTLYGVYHLLERMFHVGFFEDGEYVPKSATLALPDMDISERPAFRTRQYLSICSDAYTGGNWLFDGWQFECDYAAKKRQNLLNIDMPWVIYAYLKRNVEKDYGVSDSRMSLVAAPSAADRFDVDLYRRVTNYARGRLGAAILGPVGIVNVSPGFRKAHPEITYVQTTDLNDTTSVYVDPRSPEFKDYLVKFFTLHNKLFGTDHYYYIPAMGLETLESAFSAHRPMIRTEYGKAAFEAVKSIDPAAVMFTDGWGYMQWPPNVVDAYCSTFPKDDFLTHDMWGEIQTHSKHKAFDYYSGRNWLLGVLHSFAGDECMFGDMQRVIDMYSQVLDDPKAGNCIGTSIMPEIVNHNPIYWDLLLKATWNPRGLTVDQHLQDVALRRYGAGSAPTMYRALRKLRESVYGSYEMQATWPHAARPMYRRRMADLAPEVDQYRKRFGFIPKLRQAVETMLRESENQRNNKLYENDVADVCNQYVSEVINYNVVQMYDAFVGGDGERFEECVRAIDKCFDNKELILSSNSRYCLETEIKQAVRRAEASGRKIDEPGATPSIRAARRARKMYASPAVTEYWSKDRCELVKHYYKPKLHLYIDVLRDKIAAGEKSVSPSDVDDKYVKLAESFRADDSTRMTEDQKYRGTTAQAAADVLRNLANPVITAQHVSK